MMAKAKSSSKVGVILRIICPLVIFLYIISGVMRMIKALINIKNLTFTYPHSSTPVLKKLNLSITQGSWTTIIGANGSGKSTLVKLIDGLLVSTQGQIFIAGRQLTPHTTRQLRSEIGIVFQNPANQFVGATVEDDLAFSLENHQIPPQEINLRINAALRDVGMVSARHVLLHDLSGGQQQRIALAEVLVLKPKVIIMDEATGMLHPAIRNFILKLLKHLKQRHHLTVIDVTHLIQEVSFADSVILLHHGRVVLKGTPNQIYDHGKIVKKLGLGLPAVDVLKKKLTALGWSLPERHISTRELIKWLQQLH